LGRRFFWRIVVGRFAVDAWEQRVLIVGDRPFRNSIALGIDRLPQIPLSEQANGRGTILFGEQEPFGGAVAGRFGHPHSPRRRNSSRSMMQVTRLTQSSVPAAGPPRRNVLSELA